MTVVTIYPEDIGCSSSYDSKWLAFIKKLGWGKGANDSPVPWGCAFLVSVDMER